MKKFFLNKWFGWAAVLGLPGLFCLFSIGQCYSGNCNLNGLFIPLGIGLTATAVFCLIKAFKTEGN
jgi:hypothetical protein